MADVKLTPKIPSAYPATPTSSRPQASRPGMTQIGRGGLPSQKATAPQNSAAADQSIGPEDLTPRIPTNIIDAPTQRFYAVTAFVVIQAMKIADIAKLYTGDDGDSISELMFCIKWMAIDGLFFYFLPFMRIPWLTFSPSTTFLQIVVFCIVNVTVCFKYSVSIAGIPFKCLISWNRSLLT